MEGLPNESGFDSSDFRTNESSAGNLTCPSCRITIIPSRPRSMCPFCGNFYDPNADVDLNLRAINRSRESASGDLSRLPRIDSHRPVLRPVLGFAPLITDGLGVTLHYITGLLFRPTSATNNEGVEDNLYFTLPPIQGSRSHPNLDSAGRFNPNELPRLTPIAGKQKKSSDFLSRAANEQDMSYYEKMRSINKLSYPVRNMSCQEFKNMLDAAYESTDYTSLHTFYETTFSSFVELNALFKMNTEQEGAMLTDPQLKMELVFTIYDVLTDLPSFISKSVLKGIVTSLTTNVELKAKDEVRSIYILMQNPLFSYQSAYSVFALLLKKIVALEGTDHQLLIHWFSKSEQERLKVVVKRLLQFITIREFPPANGHKLPSLSKSKWWIPSATRVLALLNAANNKCLPNNLINYTEFYNYALDHINLMSEYYRWQNPSKNNRFSYCQYPFILSIVAKKTVLQRDSEQQMILNARRSLLNRAIHQQLPDIDVFFLNLNVRRSHLVNDSLNEIARKKGDLKKKLKVTFVGEPGLDMGGLTKEWFLLLIKQIFHEDYGMFVYHSKARCYWFSTAQMGNLREYNLIGVLMGLAVYNSIILDLHFPTACFKKLLSPPVVPEDIERTQVGLCDVSIDDFAEVMPDVAVGLKELLAYEGNVEEDFCMTFQVSVEEFREVKTHVLKPGGQDIPVTGDNREEYVHLYMNLILNKAIYQPFKAFYLGFHSVCASNALIMLRPEEVEMLVCGSPTLDMDELKKVTVYDGFNEDETYMTEFWDIMRSFSFDMQKQFLRFATGSDRVPVGGMSEMTFKISSISSNSEMLPISHTCFNQLVLPKYKNKSVLKEKLTIAISNAEGFGLE